MSKESPLQVVRDPLILNALETVAVTLMDDEVDVVTLITIELLSSTSVLVEEESTDLL